MCEEIMIDENVLKIAIDKDAFKTLLQKCLFRLFGNFQFFLHDLNFSYENGLI